MISNGIIVKDNSEIDIEDKFLSFAVCFQLTVLGIKNALVQTVPFLFSINTLLNILVYTIIVIIYIYCIGKSRKRIAKTRISLISMITFIVTSFLISSILNENSAEIIIEWLPRITICCFITFYMIAKLETMYWIEYYLTRFCYISIIFSLIAAYFIYTVGHVTFSEWITYSLPLSNTLLVAIMWLLYKFFNQERLIDVLFLIAGLIITIAYGSRNPLFSIVLYAAIQTIRNAISGKIVGWKRIIYLVVSIVSFIFIYFYKDILTILNDILQYFSINSRTIYLLTQSEISLSGRDVIYSDILEALKQHPLTGLGVAGEYSIVDIGAHGLYISILSNFGYIIGTILIVLLLWTCFKAYTCSVGINKEITLLYICIVLPRGFTGLDIWTTDVCWWLIGICLSVINISTIKKNTIKPIFSNYDKMQA